VDDFMPIGEFSARSGLSAKRLRTYAAEGLLTPAAIDPASGYRYYSPGQLSEARVIDALRQAGVPLAEIGAFLCQPSRVTLDTWALRLEMDAHHRQKALTLARGLLVASQVSEFPPTTSAVSKEAVMTTLRTSGRTDIGEVRENNEDVIVTTDRLALVADGMGGHPGGEIAANIAAGVVHAAFTGRSVEELEAAVRAANWVIRERAAAEPGLEGMGTTICAAGLLEDGRLGLVNVGDSRAYLWHEGALTQLTQDHSVTAELVQRGELTAEEAPRHPHYGVLTRALGVGPAVEIDQRTPAVEVGDRVIVCSDGLFNELTSAEIASLVARTHQVTSVADDLIDLAITHGARDNVSVVVAEVTT
jgi:serine/threonine protein phosphatase PrpC